MGHLSADGAVDQIGRDATERMAIAGQVQRDNQLDAVSANLVRAGTNFGETGQNRSIPMECGPKVDQVTRQSDAR